MANIGPGTLVRCVHQFTREDEIVPPKKGVVYTVRGTTSVPTGEVGLYLVEVVNPPCQFLTGFREMAWDVRGFVPLDDSRLDIFRTTRTDTPAKEPVAA